MHIELGFECDEPWEAMTEEGGLRRCARCNEPVVDLSRLTRKRALAILSRGTVCVSFLETASGRALVRPDPHPAGLLAGVAAGVLAACSGPSSEPPAPVAIESVRPEARAPGGGAPIAAPPVVVAPAPSEVEAPLVGDPPATGDPACTNLDAPAEAAAIDDAPAAGDAVASAPPVRRRRGRRHAPPSTPITPIQIPAPRTR